MDFETVIGLEVHVELKTDSKIFSASPNHFGAAPNSNTTVIDLGYQAYCLSSIKRLLILQ